MATTENNQLAVIENSIEVLKTGPEILESNQQRKDKALTVGRNILSIIQEEGMTPELDERAKNYLINIATASRDMKDQRSAVTQIMDNLKKMYTEVENELDPKKPGTVPAQVQAARDAYAKQVAEEQENKRREAERTAAKQKEAIELKYQVEKDLLNQYSTHLVAKKNKIQAGFNAITLEDYKDKSLGLQEYLPLFVFQPAEFSIRAVYHSPQELGLIKEDVIRNKMKEFGANYIAEMTLLRDELIEKLPSKLAELKEQKRLADEAKAAARAAAEAKSKADKEKAEAAARAAAEAAKKAEEEKQRREQEEKERIETEENERISKAQMEADIKKQGEETMVMFEQEAAMAEDTPSPEMRQGYEIEVLHPVGYTQIFALWFEKMGKDMPVDKLGNTKLEQMKAWAEKEAHKSGTRIDSKFLKYTETFKAVNRKAK